MDNLTILIVLFLVIGGYLLTTSQLEGNSRTVLIILIVIVSVILIINLPMFQSYTQTLDTPSDASITTNTISSSQYTQKSQNYSISTWIYVSDWNVNLGAVKYIMQRQTNDTVTSGLADNPSLSLDTFDNNLIVKFQTVDPAGIKTKPNKSNTITIPNISIQKWVNITVCFGDSHVDTYINGKLVNTYVTTGVQYMPTYSSSSPNPPFNITKPGYGGWVSQCRYYDRFLTPKEAWDIYTAGVKSNILSQYSAKFTFYNQQVPTDIQLF